MSWFIWTLVAQFLESDLHRSQYFSILALAFLPLRFLALIQPILTRRAMICFVLFCFLGFAMAFEGCSCFPGNQHRPSVRVLYTHTSPPHATEKSFSSPKAVSLKMGPLVASPWLTPYLLLYLMLVFPLPNVEHTLWGNITTDALLPPNGTSPKIQSQILSSLHLESSPWGGNNVLGANQRKCLRNHTTGKKNAWLGEKVTSLFWTWFTSREFRGVQFQASYSHGGNLENKTAHD